MASKMVKCPVNSDWFQRTDFLGYKISTWAKKSSDTEIFCTVCLKTISCDAKGFQAITQHVGTKKHKDNSLIKLNECQLYLSKGRSSEESSEIAICSSLSSTHQSSLQLYCTKQAAMKAELIWCLKNVVYNMSAASCDGIAEVFHAMFPDVIPKDFSLGRVKLGYLITEAFGPYFYKMMTEVVQGPYVMIYDETTNMEGKKELQIAIHFWSELQSEVVTHHLESFFLSYATAEDIVQHLQKALDNSNLPQNHLLMLGSDGPNINKKVFRLMNEDAKETRGKGLIDIGTCNIHAVHNAFCKGLDHLGNDVSDLIISIYYFFNGWPTRWEDFTNIQKKHCLPLHRFIKHVPSRWLTLFDSAKRLLEQWIALEEYFLDTIPKEKKALQSSTKYLRISNVLRKSITKAEVQFVVNSAQIYQKFLEMFQLQEPLIHLLYDELFQLLLTLIGRFCKPSVQERLHIAIINQDDLFKEENLLSIEEIDIGESNCSIRHLGDRKNDVFKKSSAALLQQQSLASARYIVNKTSLLNGHVKHFRFLQPQQISTEQSFRSLLKVAKILPIEIEQVKLWNEWRMLRLEEDVKNSKQFLRVDHFWAKINKMKTRLGESRYPNISLVVKCCLPLSHGSADVERGFSVSRRILTDEKAAMSLCTLNARLYVKDGMCKYKNRPELVPITKKLLISAQQAHHNYQCYLAEEKE